MLTPQIIENALAFLGRAQLAGNEVPAFCDVNNALQAELRKMQMAEAAAAETPPTGKTTKAK